MSKNTTRKATGRVAIPARLQKRPKDERGFPIPFITEMIDGKPDFRVTNMLSWRKVVKDRLCGLCGHKMDYFIYFIGGPKSCAGGLFFDPAMHQECARYALAVCPFLAYKSGAYSQRDTPENTVTNELMDDKRPERFGLYSTRDYQVMQMGQNMVIKADPAVSIEWKETGENPVRDAPNNESAR